MVPGGGLQWARRSCWRWARTCSSRCCASSGTCRWQRTHGWELLSALGEPGRLLPGAEAKNIAVVYAPNYQFASQAARYAGVVTDTAGPGRKSQYDLWPEPVVSPGQDALWFSFGNPPPEELASRFTSVEGPVELPANFRGQRVHTFHVWWLREARSAPHAPPPALP